MSLTPPAPTVPPAETRVYAAPDGHLHLAAVDGLRALAALFVVAHHISRTLYWPHPPPPSVAPFVGPLEYGHYAVSVFIVISGFCLMLPVVRAGGVLRGGAGRFFRRRALRILPTYYCVFFFTALFLNHGISKKQALAHLLLVHNLWPSTYGSINGAWWSVAVECQIYLLFPLLVWLWRRCGPGWTTLLSVAAGYGGWYILRGSIHAGLTPHFVALFGLGMLGATWHRLLTPAGKSGANGLCGGQAGHWAARPCCAFSTACTGRRLKHPAGQVAMRWPDWGRCACW